MMTAETQVHEQVAEVSTNPKPSVEIQRDQCGFDVTSYEDLPKLPVPDCNGNGISHLDEDGISRDDTEDNSYVFVSGNDDLVPIDNVPKGNSQISDDSEVVEVQTGEFLNSSASGVESSWVFEGSQVASSNNFSADKTDADAPQVAITGDAAQQNVTVGSPEYHQNYPNSSLAADENQESEVGILELGPSSANNFQPEISLDIAELIDNNQQSQEQNNFGLASGLGEGGEPQLADLEAKQSQSSQVGVLGAGAGSVGKPEPETEFDLLESIDVNKKCQDENLGSACESGESGDSQNAGLEVTSGESSEVEISNGDVIQQNIELSEGGTEESKIVQSDSATHASPLVNMEGQSDTESKGSVPFTIAEQLEPQDGDILDNDGEKLKDRTMTQLPDAKENQETITVLSESHVAATIPEQSELCHDNNLDKDGKKLEELTKKLPSDAKEIQETMSVLGENGIMPIAIAEQSEFHLDNDIVGAGASPFTISVQSKPHHEDNLGNDEEKLEEQTNTQLPVAKENRETITVLGESHIAATTPEQSELHQDDNLENDGKKLDELTRTQISSDTKEMQETVSALGENGVMPIAVAEQAFTISAQMKPQHGDNLGNDGEKLEVEIMAKLSSDAKENQETITALSVNGIMPITSAEKSEFHLDNNLGGTASFPVTIPEQSEFYHDDNLGNDLEKLGEETKKQLPSYAKENQKATNILIENGEIPEAIPELSESACDDNLDNDGQNLDKQTKAHVPSDAKENQEYVTAHAENGDCDVDSEHKIEKSMNEIELQLGRESAFGAVLPDIKTPDSSVIASVPETKASVELIDNSERSLELPQSSESNDNLTPAADSDIGQRPVESDANVVIARENSLQEREAKDNASPSTENIAAKAHEIIKPQIGDADSVAVEIFDSDNLDNDGQNLDQQTKTHVPSDAKENPESVTVLAENGDCDVDSEHKIEKSVNEIELQLGRESACGAVLPDIKTPDSSVIANVPETKASVELVELIDSSERSLELLQSSESNDNLTPAADSDIGQRPVESDGSVVIVRENGLQEHEAEDNSSSSIENIAAKAHEIVKPQIGDADSVAVETFDSALHCPTECGMEYVSSCLAENDDVTGVDSAGCSVGKVINSLEFELQTPDPKVSTFQVNDVLLKTEVSIVGGESSDSLSVPSGVEKEFEGEISSVISSRDMPCSEVSTTQEVDEEDTEVDNFAGGDNTSCSVKTVVNSGPEVSTAQINDVHLKTEVSIVRGEFSNSQSVPSEAEKEFDIGGSSVISRRDMPYNDLSDGSVTKDRLLNPVPEHVDIENKTGYLSGEHLISDDQLVKQETKDVENSPNDSKSLSLMENSIAGAMPGQDVLVETLTRPFHFLVRIPRFEDLKMKEQIIRAQLLVEEKTQHRDAFRIEVQKYKANCLGYAAEYEAALSESRALKRSVRAKRAEIDSLQSVINKVKNAMSVEDIDTRIHSMEHMIEHETLPLKEEKLLIREIKQLKQLREQLSSNIGSQDEVQQALNNRDQIKERLKVLKKELDSLKDSVLKADAVARALEKKYEDENKKVKEVQNQYSAANNVRQDAYAHLQSLRKQLFEKNQHFRMYKENAAAASNYAMKRDREALHHLCINQVESVIELWNKNDEFRKDYVRCNMKSTLRRLGTLDGRSLGPDEQPPVLASYAEERVDRLVSNPSNSGPLSQTQVLEQDVVKPVHGLIEGDKTKVDEKNSTTRPKKQEKSVLGNGHAAVSRRELTDETREVQHVRTLEELESARKVEDQRKEEDAAKLKEQRRLEEKAKALEALERKKKNAEKAQVRAELRAQKEAEQREKEREKRMRKKERKKGSASEVPEGNNLVETATPTCESSTESSTKEAETKENLAATSKRSQKPSQFTKQSKTKSIPPPLRNRSRKKLQQWMWIILTCLLVIALFLLGNVGLFSNLSSLRRRNTGF